MGRRSAKAISVSAGLGAVAVALGMLGSGCASSVAKSFATQHFVSRPDLRPPPVTVLSRAHGTAPGYLFVSPERGVDQAGPLILDDAGQAVWFHPVSSHRVTSFRVQRYRGRPVLTWWSAEREKGSGHNGRVRDRRRPLPDHRDPLRPRMVCRGPARVPAHAARHRRRSPLTRRSPTTSRALGGSAHGAIWEGIVQEVDVATGRLLFEWHSIDHVARRRVVRDASEGSRKDLRLLPHQRRRPPAERRHARLRPEHARRL